MDYVLELERIKNHIRHNVKDEGTYQILKKLLNAVQDEIENRELMGERSPRYGLHEFTPDESPIEGETGHRFGDW